MYLFKSNRIQPSGTEIHLLSFCCFCCCSVVLLHFFFLFFAPSFHSCIMLHDQNTLLYIQTLCFHSVSLLDLLHESSLSTHNLKIDRAVFISGSFQLPTSVSVYSRDLIVKLY